MVSNTPLIELQNIRRSYGGHDGAPQVTVLRGLSLAIAAGRTVTINSAVCTHAA